MYRLLRLVESSTRRDHHGLLLSRRSHSCVVVATVANSARTTTKKKDAPPAAAVRRNYHATTKQEVFPLIAAGLLLGVGRYSYKVSFGDVRKLIVDKSKAKNRSAYVLHIFSVHRR